MTDPAVAANSIAFGANVRLERDGDIALVVIDNPPVNASSQAVRRGLLDAFNALSASAAGARAIVLMGAGRTFVSGSDIREFGQALPEPDLPTVIAAIEACPIPVVAAIHGAALGGGFELALGCDWRIADGKAVVGLPEVQLGMIPGAGGTQRLPRLVGIAAAIDLIASGRRVPAGEAVALGAVDDIASGDLREFALAFAGEHDGAKRRVSAMDVAADPQADARAEAETLRHGRGRLCVREAIETVRLAATLPFQAALQRERATFQRLRMSEEARALRYGFFAERAAAKLPGPAPGPARAIALVGVVGAGTMGADIAAVTAAAGIPVRVVDNNAAALEKARAAIAATLAGLHGADKLGGRSPEECLALLHLAQNPDELADADILVEAVFEDFAVKRDVLSRLAVISKPDAVIASNTSYIDLDRLGEAGGAPERTIGLHFFAPAARMRLLEVVAARCATAETLAAGIAFARRIGKLPVVAAPSEGFIGNRIFSRYRAQCEYAVEDGAQPAAVDAAARSLGFAMGPFAVADLSGLDIAWRYRQSKVSSRDPRERYVPIADELCELGRLGRKAGAGWYDYDAEGKAVPSPQVAEIIARNVSRRGGPVPDESLILRRLHGAIVNEAALVMAEGVARSAAEIDLVMVHGYGYSRFKGGPLFQAVLLPAAEVAEMVDAAADAAGFGFRRGDVEALLTPLRSAAAN